MQKPKFIPPEQAKPRMYRQADGKVKLRPLERSHAKIGRNAICPCGSMRKFKKCHGAKVRVTTQEREQ